MEQAAALLEEGAQLHGVDEVAVVGQCEVARAVHEQERLHVVDAAAARGRVADMTDRHVAGQRFDIVLVEHLGHQAFALDAMEDTVVDAHDAAAFLAAVLQRVESVVGERSRIFNAENTEHAALFVDRSVLINSHLLSSE